MVDVTKLTNQGHRYDQQTFDGFVGLGNVLRDIEHADRGDYLTAGYVFDPKTKDKNLFKLYCHKEYRFGPAGARRRIVAAELVDTAGAAGLPPPSRFHHVERISFKRYAPFALKIWETVLGLCEVAGDPTEGEIEEAIDLVIPPKLHNCKASTNRATAGATTSPTNGATTSPTGGGPASPTTTPTPAPAPPPKLSDVVEDLDASLDRLIASTAGMNPAHREDFVAEIVDTITAALYDRVRPFGCRISTSHGKGNPLAGTDDEVRASLREAIVATISQANRIRELEADLELARIDVKKTERRASSRAAEAEARVAELGSQIVAAKAHTAELEARAAELEGRLAEAEARLRAAEAAVVPAVIEPGEIS